MKELLLIMLGSQHSYGLCSPKWPFSVQHVGVGQKEGCLVGPTHRGCAALHTANPPTQSSRATGGGEWLPPVAPPVCHQHPSHPQGLGQHKQTTSWAVPIRLPSCRDSEKEQRQRSAKSITYIIFSFPGQHSDNPL